MRRTVPAVALKVMRIIIPLRLFQRSVILKFSQSRGLELRTNELLVLLELVLRIGETFFEQPDLSLGLRETNVRVQIGICVFFCGAGRLVIRVDPIVGLQL